MVVIPYYPIRDENLKKIVELKLGKIKRRLLENHKVNLAYDGRVIDEVAKRCTEVESGARNVDNILTNTLLPDLSRRLLTGIAEGRKLSNLTVAIEMTALSSIVVAMLRQDNPPAPVLHLRSGEDLAEPLTFNFNRHSGLAGRTTAAFA